MTNQERNDMAYTLVMKMDGNEIEMQAETFENAISAYHEFEFENLFEHFIERVQIYRSVDNFLMYDSEHNYALSDYELFSIDKWNELDHLYKNGNTECKPSVYIDVDGTLAYWHKDGKGLMYPEEILDPKNHYYRHLEPHQFLVDLAKTLFDNEINVCVLSATDRCCIPDRFAWIHEHLPFIPMQNIYLCPIGADKTNFCENSEISILIDDYEKNLSEWDGLSVKSVNSINSISEKFINIPTYKIETELSQREYENKIQEYSDLIIQKIQTLGKELPDISVRVAYGEGKDEMIFFNYSDKFYYDLIKESQHNFSNFEMSAIFKNGKPRIIIEELTYDQNVFDITDLIPEKYMNQIKEVLSEKFPQSKLKNFER